MSISLPPEPCPPVPRRSTVRVHGQQVVIECPPWCVTAHDDAHDALLDDVVHESAPTALSVPSSSSGQEQVLIVRLVQWPFADQESDRRVSLSLEVAEDSDVVKLDASLASSVAKSMEEHAARLRKLAEVVTS
ncbi:DUF6907 domain-containing protein [Streptomyces monomycini]|uniref:DUF6907 domain-containing protein n=1 Tax=Streptomyces monomycini TaxID=371720 RepID=UPI001EEB2B25|nr:hypothetical protein [Streptomyces monomycini]